LSHGEEHVKCKDCGGEGTLTIHGSLKTCRYCDGLGRVPAINQAQRVLRDFQLPQHYTVAHGQSVLLKFSRYRIEDVVSGSDIDVVIKSLFAFTVSGIKAKIVYPI